MNNLYVVECNEAIFARVFESSEYVDGTNVREVVNAVAPNFGLRPEYFVTVSEAAARVVAAALTPVMKRELRSIAHDGNPSDPYDWQHAPEALWFHARDRVIGALLRRRLIVAERGYELTTAGRDVIHLIGERA